MADLCPGRNAWGPSRVPDVVGAILAAGPATTGGPRRPARLAGPAGLASAAGAGAVVLIVAWWRGAPPATGPGAALTDAGRLTGFVAGYVAVLQLLLRARLRPIEQGLGTDRINATHRLLGPYLVLLVLAHGALVAAGYSRRLRTPLPSQLGALVTDFSYVSWAAAAAGILVVVGVMSMPSVRRRLPHEVWHCLHLLVYVALALAFFHQVAVGGHYEPGTHELSAGRVRAAFEERAFCI